MHRVGVARSAPQHQLFFEELEFAGVGFNRGSQQDLWGLAGSSGRAAAGRSDNNCLASHTGTPDVAVTSSSRPSMACPWFG